MKVQSPDKILPIEDAKFFFFCNIYLLYSKKNFEYITLHYFTCSIRCTFSKIKKTWLASPVTFPSKKLNLISKDWQRHNFNYISQFVTGKEFKVLISPHLRTAKNCKKHLKIACMINLSGRIFCCCTVFVIQRAEIMIKFQNNIQ